MRRACTESAGDSTPSQVRVLGSFLSPFLITSCRNYECVLSFRCFCNLHRRWWNTHKYHVFSCINCRHYATADRSFEQDLSGRARPLRALNIPAGSRSACARLNVSGFRPSTQTPYYSTVCVRERRVVQNDLDESGAR